MAQNESWEKQYKALAVRCSNLDEQVRALAAANAVMEAEKRQWQADKIRWEGMVQNHLGSGDSKVHELEQEIIALRGKLKAAGIDAKG